MHTSTHTWTLTGFAHISSRSGSEVQTVGNWEQAIQHLQGRHRGRRGRKKCRLVCTCETWVRAKLEELSRKKAPVCVFVDNWFVCVEQAGAKAAERSDGVKQRGLCFPAAGGRDSVSNWGRSPRGSLSDWPFTVPCQS